MYSFVVPSALYTHSFRLPHPAWGFISSLFEPGSVSFVLHKMKPYNSVCFTIPFYINV